MLTGNEYILVGFAAVLGGMVNAIAGGGTLITFPMLTAVGIPAVTANITNTVALCPGYLSGTFAQFKDLKGQGTRIYWLLPASVLGGIAGGFLLMHTGEKAFRILVPYLILLAAGLLAIQEPLRKRIVSKTAASDRPPFHMGWSLLPVIPAAIYGGYFGAGVSVIILAVLGLVFDDSLTRLNALKQLLSFSINISAAIFFLFSGHVLWPVALVMTIGALAGGTLGGKLASRIRPVVLRWIVVIIGLAVSVVYFIK